MWNIRTRQDLKNLSPSNNLLIRKFLKRHPNVVWEVPEEKYAEHRYDQVDTWAPSLFANRQLLLMNGNKISEEDAYQQVVREGGGGGNWHGVFEKLDHSTRWKNPRVMIEKLNMPKVIGSSLLDTYDALRKKETASGMLRMIDTKYKSTDAKRKEMEDLKSYQYAQGIRKDVLAEQNTLAAFREGAGVKLEKMKQEKRKSDFIAQWEDAKRAELAKLREENLRVAKMKEMQIRTARDDRKRVVSIV